MKTCFRKYVLVLFWLSYASWEGWFHKGSVRGIEESFFSNGFNMLNYFPDHHVRMSDLKVNESYVLKQSNSIDVEMALSALKGLNMEHDVDYKNTKHSEGEERSVDMDQWNRVTKDDFFNNNNNTDSPSSKTKSHVSIKEKETAMKGMPDPYYINNMNDDMRDIIFYYNDDDLESKELVYKGTYIPRIYNHLFLILLIISAYLYCLKVIIGGFLQGKSVAKFFIPKVSTLFVFFLSLRMLLNFFPISLSTFITLVATYYFSTISMKPFEQFFFLRESKIKKEPIGWVFIVCMQSLLLGHLLYHFLITVDIINKTLPYINDSPIMLFLFYVVLSLSLTALIFLIMTSTIFPAKKTQNLVFSFLSSYLLISFYTYIHNCILLRYMKQTKIFQLEPIMFFSYKPKFVYNTQNSIALFFLFVMTCISLILPKWLKKTGVLGRKSKTTDKSSNTYDILLSFWT